MLRINDIFASYLHLIGWQQNYDTSELLIANSLTESTSGYFFQQTHPLLTLKNLKAIAPDYANSPYAAYVPGNQYIAGQTCKLGNISYRAIVANKDVEPGSDVTKWEVFDAFSTWIEDKTKAGIIQALTTFVTKKANDSNAQGIMLNKTLFNGTGRLSDLTIATDSIVGLEIIPVRSKGVTTKIEKIGLQFKGTGVITLYLMHSSRVEPVKIIELTRTKDGSMEWFKQEDLFLPFMSDDVDSGGSWYLVYSQNALPAGNVAINKVLDWSTGPCVSCNRLDVAQWQAWNKYLNVYPFKTHDPDADEQVNTTIDMWDVADGIYTLESNYGINLEVSVMCDLTDFIIDQKTLFTDLIAKQVAILMLREMAFNPNVRINRTALNASKADILYELDGDSTSMKKSGLVYQFDQSLKALDLNTRGINPVCLPCKKQGVRYKSI